MRRGEQAGPAVVEPRRSCRPPPRRAGARPPSPSGGGRARRRRPRDRPRPRPGRAPRRRRGGCRARGGAAWRSPRPGRRGARARRRSPWPRAPGRAAAPGAPRSRRSPRNAPSPRTARNVSAVDRRVHHAHERAVGVLQRHADRPGREAVEEVDRAVERVDDPAPAAGGLGARALLGHQPVIGRSRASSSRIVPLGLPIGVGDEVGRRGLRLHPLGRAPVVARAAPRRPPAPRARPARGPRSQGAGQAARGRPARPATTQRPRSGTERPPARSEADSASESESARGLQRGR